jgi:hypothetical protein
MPTMSKQAIVKFVPGLFTIPDHLTAKVKHGGKAYYRQQKELAEFMKEQELRIMEACKWLQHDGYIVFKTMDRQAYDKLKKKEKLECVKVSSVLGGIYSLTCVIKRDNAEQQLAGRVDDSVNKIILAHRIKVEEWERRNNGRTQLQLRPKKEREAEMIHRGFYTEGRRGKKTASYDKLNEWVGAYPELPELPKAKRGHVVRTIKITLEAVTTKHVIKNKKVQKNGRTITKKIHSDVEVSEVVKELIAPLPDEVRTVEIPRVVADVVARIPRGAGLPKWDRYDYEVVESK